MDQQCYFYRNGSQPPQHFWYLRSINSRHVKWQSSSKITRGNYVVHFIHFGYSIWYSYQLPCATRQIHKGYFQIKSSMMDAPIINTISHHNVRKRSSAKASAVPSGIPNAQVVQAAEGCRGNHRPKPAANLTTSMPIWTHCTSKSIRLYVVWIIYLYTFVHTTNRYYARRLIQHDFATVLLPPLEFARRFDNRLEYGWDITNHFS